MAAQVTHRGHRPRHSAGLDPAANGRANAAYKFAFDKWQLLIDAAMADKSLSPDQRDAAVAALRIRQEMEANGARRRVMEEEKQKANAARRAVRALLKSPLSPT